MSLYDFLYYVIMPVLAVSALLVFIRFLKGPRVVDRVICLDLIITIGLAAMGVYSVISGQSVYLDVSMILALIAFLGTVAFSYYLEKRNR